MTHGRPPRRGAAGLFFSSGGINRGMQAAARQSVIDRQAGGRSAGVDAMRFVAFVAVCTVHTVLWGQDLGRTPGLGEWLTVACRFCVPFFFLASGYFSARPGSAARVLARAGPVFLFWVLVYVAATPGGLARLLRLKFDLLTLIDGGPGFHLWFLPALIVGVFAAEALHGRRRSVAAWVILVAGLLGWAASSFGPGRVGPYAGRYLSAVAYVCAGAFWRAHHGGPTPAPRWVAGLILGGLLLAGLEAGLLSAAGIRPVGAEEFPLGAALMSAGLFSAALSWRPEAIAGRLAARAGRWMLGLYAVHLGVAMLLFAVLPWATLAERLSVCGLTIFGSWTAVAILRRTPLRRFVA